MTDFKFKVPVQVRFRDTDAMGHVNNAVYLSYLEFARMKYWETLMNTRDYSKVDFILARAEIDYRSPVKLGEDIEIHVRVSEMRRSSWVFQYRLTSSLDGRLVAEASTVQASYDYKLGKVKRLDDEMRGKISAFEGGVVA